MISTYLSRNLYKCHTILLYKYLFSHAVRILHPLPLWSKTLQGSTKKARKPTLLTRAEWVSIDSRMSMEEMTAGPTATLPDQEILTNSPQDSLQGKENRVSYLTVFFSSSLAVPCLFCCFENGMGRNCLTLGPGCFRKAPVLLANMSSLWGSGNFTLFSVPPLCWGGISSCSWLSSCVTVLLRETSDTVPW